jgi:hypothetical protein
MIRGDAPLASLSIPSLLLLLLFSPLLSAINQPSSLRSALSGLYLLDETIVYLDEKGKKSSYCAADRCPIFNSPLSLVLRDYNASKLPAKYSLFPNSLPECIDICRALEPVAKKNSDTLLVFTTCNHLNMSVLSLQALRHARDSFDLVVIDDHSVDGTPDYLRKKVALASSTPTPVVTSRCRGSLLWRRQRPLD